MWPKTSNYSQNPTEVSKGIPPHNRFMFPQNFASIYVYFGILCLLEQKRLPKLTSRPTGFKGIDANGIGCVEIAIPHFKHSKSNFTTIHRTQNIKNSFQNIRRTASEYPQQQQPLQQATRKCKFKIWAVGSPILLRSTYSSHKLTHISFRQN